MGLRAASVRSANAVVMAPALTEAGQSQNFSLPPSSPVTSVPQADGDERRPPPLAAAALRVKCSLDELFGVSAMSGGGGARPPAPTAADVDQLLLHNLAAGGGDTAAAAAADDLVGGGGGAPNVDELLQVIKHMEGVGGGGVGGGEPLFPDAFDRELFGACDVLGMCEASDAAAAATGAETLAELGRQQLRLERRADFLLRRLRRVRARAMGRHVSAEVAGVFELVHRTLQRRGATPKPQQPQSAAGDAHNGALADVPPVPVQEQEQEEEEDVRPVGGAAVQRLVQRVHRAATHQASTARPRHAARYFGSGSTEPAAARASTGVVSVPPLRAAARDELERTAGTLQCQLGLVETQLDSDATASSSGAESCDEMQTYANPHQNFLSIGKRAAWRYANERAAVASRWTWLQAQISDLEYRIRQHNELHRQIRACKGAVSLGEAVGGSSSSSNSAQHQAPNSSLPASPNAVNGYRGQLPGATKSSSADDLLNGVLPSASSGSGNASGAAGGSARTRPLNRAVFRKRKLLQTTGLHTLSKKASRPTNIRCGCVPPVVPCALCTGRTDPTFPRDLPEQLTVPERIALLDPGYHPVLSFPDDISQSIHLEAIMKLPDWQQKTLRCNIKSLKGLSKLERVDKLNAGLDSNRPKKSEHPRKYNRMLKSGAPNTFSNKLKNKVGRGRKPLRMNRKRHNARMAMAQMHSLASESMDEEMEALGATSSAGKSGGDSLTPSPLSHVQVMPYRRSRVDSYDIDNIVIPYSVAASTRVEKLQYKEILTPKWRVIDSEYPGMYHVKNNGILRRTSQDSDVEDVTDETIAVRHDKCEHDEKKKFLSYIKFPLAVGRPRANRRTDSRAESSGANTPDPMSPHTGENSEAVSSPLTSPPATPISMLTTNEDSLNATGHAQNSALRRRTVSQSRWTDHRCNTPDNLETVPPYEARSFPLAEEVYEKMLKFMPEGHPMPNSVCLNKQSSRDSDGVTESPMFGDLRAESPVSSESTESAIPEEDPNDPEWMDAEKIQIRDRTKR